MDSMPQLLKALGSTIEYSIAAIVAAIIIGLIAALFKLSRFWLLRFIGTVYVEIFRCTPLLVQIFYFVFALPLLLPLNKWFGMTLYPILAGATALALNEGAYITEIVRAGILGVDRGQREAAQSLGMNGFQTMRFIILPQAFKRMIPPLVNQFAQAIKDTSLLAPVGIVELVYTGQIIVSENFQALQIWSAVGVLYFVVIFAMTRFAAFIERRLQIDKR